MAERWPLSTNESNSNSSHDWVLLLDKAALTFGEAALVVIASIATRPSQTWQLQDQDYSVLALPVYYS